MGKVVTLNADGTYTSEVKEGIIEKSLAGVMAAFGGDNKAVTSDISMFGQLTTNIVNMALTSIYTRRQAESGAPAVLGVFF